MLVVRMEEREPAHAAPHQGKRGVEDRHAQAHNGHQHDGRDRALVRTGQRERRNTEADQVGAAIPKVNPGRAEN